MFVKWHSDTLKEHRHNDVEHRCEESCSEIVLDPPSAYWPRRGTKISWTGTNT